MTFHSRSPNVFNLVNFFDNFFYNKSGNDVNDSSPDFAQRCLDHVVDDSLQAFFIGGISILMMMIKMRRHTSPFEVQRPRAFVVSVTDTGPLLPRQLPWAY